MAAVCNSFQLAKDCGFKVSAAIELIVNIIWQFLITSLLYACGNSTSRLSAI